MLGCLRAIPVREQGRAVPTMTTRTFARGLLQHTLGQAVLEQAKGDQHPPGRELNSIRVTKAGSPDEKASSTRTQANSRTAIG